MHHPLCRGFGPVAIAVVAVVSIAAAEPRVQEITGHLVSDEALAYRLTDLRRGRTLYAFVERTEGNLDPLIALVRPDVDVDALQTEARKELAKSITAGEDPLVRVPAVFDKYSLSWADDISTGGSAGLAYEIPSDGDYRLLVRGNFIIENFGTFRLLVGVDAPGVLDGTAEPAGAEFVALEQVGEPVDRVSEAVSITEDVLTPQNSPLFFLLKPIRADRTLYVYVEALSGDLKPILFLADHAGKPIRSDNLAAAGKVAGLSYTFKREQRDFQIRLSSVPKDGPATQGRFRLIVGVNSPEVLTGEAKVQGAPVLQPPLKVRVGLSLRQIADVNQKAERYDAVYDLVMRWQDPKLAYRPVSPADSVRIFAHEDFLKYAKQNNIMPPTFVVSNQQERRWSQSRRTIIMPDGRAIYIERFWARLQAPDFQFTKFPFDTQKFFARIAMMFPTRYFLLDKLEQFSRVGTALGEEEWVVSSHKTVIDEIRTAGASPRASFSFIFYAHRHLNYYILRIFLPVLAIIAIAWVTFFLEDYSKRVDLAGANLLVFIAFNFTIAGDLPRLGYLTVMDIVLISTFLITAIVLVCCVCLRRMETVGLEVLARKIDKYLVVAYPLAYLAVGAGIATMLM